MLVTLTARELAPNANIIAAVREAENQHLLKQSGADTTVVTSDSPAPGGANSKNYSKKDVSRQQ